MYQCSQLQIVLSCVCLFGIYGFSNKHKQAHNINIEIDHEKVIECKNTTFLGI